MYVELITRHGEGSLSQVKPLALVVTDRMVCECHVSPICGLSIAIPEAVALFTYTKF